MSSIPTRPKEKPEISKDEERIIRERLSTFDEDEKQARPWAEVKARILKQLKPH